MVPDVVGMAVATMLIVGWSADGQLQTTRLPTFDEIRIAWEQRMRWEERVDGRRTGRRIEPHHRCAGGRVSGPVLRAGSLLLRMPFQFVTHNANLRVRGVYLKVEDNIPADESAFIKPRSPSRQDKGV